jgi:hypothetical protein
MLKDIKLTPVPVEISSPDQHEPTFLPSVSTISTGSCQHPRTAGTRMEKHPAIPRLPRWIYNRRRWNTDDVENSNEQPVCKGGGCQVEVGIRFEDCIEARGENQQQLAISIRNH